MEQGRSLTPALEREQLLRQGIGQRRGILGDGECLRMPDRAAPFLPVPGDEVIPEPVRFGNRFPRLAAPKIPVSLRPRFGQLSGIATDVRQPFLDLADVLEARVDLSLD